MTTEVQDLQVDRPASHRPRGWARPESLSEVAGLAGTEGGFDASLREFLDTFYGLAAADRPTAIGEEPARIGAVHDAYLAAVAEHLALRFGIGTPAWTEAPDRFLAEPFFAGGLEGLKAILLVESPLAFRRRLIFVSHDALSRPRDTSRAAPTAPVPSPAA